MTNESDVPWVVDTGPLSHFARAQWLGVLRAVAGSRPILIPDTVDAELRVGAPSHPHLQAVLDCDWIDVMPLRTDEELAALARYADLLVGAGTRNLGEAGVLALAETRGAVAVLDDRVAVNAARERGVTVRRTLGLLIEGVRAELLTVPLISAIADDLMAGEYRLPFGPGGFVDWAVREGVLPDPEGRARPDDRLSL